MGFSQGALTFCEEAETAEAALEELLRRCLPPPKRQTRRKRFAKSAQVEQFGLETNVTSRFTTERVNESGKHSRVESATKKTISQNKHAIQIKVRWKCAGNVLSDWFHWKCG